MKCRDLKCNNESLATMVDHICIECMDLYIYCPQCTVDPEPLSGHVDHDHEEDFLTTYKFKLWRQSGEAWKRRNEAWKLIEE